MSEEAAPVTGPPSNLAAGIVKAIRPRQWVKNLLVLAAPLAALGAGVRYNYAEVLVKVAIAFVAHLAAVLIKRAVRRQRPRHPAVGVNVGTPSTLSFPSAHATSTTAASVLMAPLTGLPLPVLLVPPMALSRMVLGVHYPSDVLAGVAVGAVVAKAVQSLSGVHHE